VECVGGKLTCWIKCLCVVKKTNSLQNARQREVTGAKCLACSGAETNLKVGAPAHFRSQAPEKNCRALPTFWLYKYSTVSRFGKRFLDSQYSLVSFLFAVLLLTVPPCPAICGGRAPVPYGVGATVCMASASNRKHKEVVQLQWLLQAGYFWQVTERTYVKDKQ